MLAMKTWIRTHINPGTVACVSVILVFLQTDGKWTQNNTKKLSGQIIWSTQWHCLKVDNRDWHPCLHYDLHTHTHTCACAHMLWSYSCPHSYTWMHIYICIHTYHTRKCISSLRCISVVGALGLTHTHTYTHKCSCSKHVKTYFVLIP